MNIKWKRQVKLGFSDLRVVKPKVRRKEPTFTYQTVEEEDQNGRLIRYQKRVEFCPDESLTVDDFSLTSIMRVGATSMLQECPKVGISALDQMKVAEFAANSINAEIDRIQAQELVEAPEQPKTETLTDNE